MTPGQGLEPRPPRSGRGVLAVRRSRIVEISLCLAAHVLVLQRCCPSLSPTLRPWIAPAAGRTTGASRPSWRRSGARRSRGSRNEQAKAAVIATASITAPERARTFLSQAGPRVSSWSSSAEHRPFSGGGSIALKRRRRPSRVALASSCYAARRLAEAPPGEGGILLEPAAFGELLPARRTRRGGRRVRGEQMDVDGVQHRWCGDCAAPDRSRNTFSAQVQFTKPAPIASRLRTTADE